MKCTDCKFYENECESHFQQELIGRKRSLEICEMFYPKTPIFIEASILIEDLKDAEASGGMGSVVARTLMRYIRRQKTVDAVEVVHGRWEKNWSGDNIVYCNQCYMPQDVPTPYCASCGSKMDGERNVDL